MGPYIFRCKTSTFWLKRISCILRNRQPQLCSCTTITLKYKVLTTFLSHGIFLNFQHLLPHPQCETYKNPPEKARSKKIVLNNIILLLPFISKQIASFTPSKKNSNFDSFSQRVFISTLVVVFGIFCNFFYFPINSYPPSQFFKICALNLIEVS